MNLGMPAGTNTLTTGAAPAPTAQTQPSPGAGMGGGKGGAGGGMGGGKGSMPGQGYQGMPNGQNGYQGMPQSTSQQMSHGLAGGNQQQYDQMSEQINNIAPPVDYTATSAPAAAAQAAPEYSSWSWADAAQGQGRMTQDPNTGQWMDSSGKPLKAGVYDQMINMQNMGV